MSRAKAAGIVALAVALLVLWVWGVFTKRAIWTSLRQHEALERRVEALERGR